LLVYLAPLSALKLLNLSKPVLLLKLPSYMPIKSSYALDFLPSPETSFHGFAGLSFEIATATARLRSPLSIAITVSGSSGTLTVLDRAKWANHFPSRLTISTVANSHFPSNASSTLCFCLSPKAIGRLTLPLLFRLRVSQYDARMLVVLESLWHLLSKRIEVFLRLRRRSFLFSLKLFRISTALSLAVWIRAVFRLKNFLASS